MQTFLPYPDFGRVAETLDYRRLGKQRVEARQIYDVVAGNRTTGGFLNHPAIKMWMYDPDALALYHNIMICEWVQRGYKNNMPLLEYDEVTYPSWLGGPIHATHRSNLLRKDPEYYGQFNWLEPNDLEYIWP